MIECRKNIKNNLTLLERIDKIFNEYSKNNFIDESLLEIYTNTDVDCLDVNNILIRVFVDDQEVRTTGDKDMYVVDSINLIKVNSIIKKCKNEVYERNLSFKSYQAIFLTLQHSGDKDLMSYYYHIIKKLIDKEKIDKGILALYVDRFLLLDNKKQIFGTQIKNNNLYELESPFEVNERRRYMELESIEKYLMRFGLIFKDEINEQKK